MATDPPASGGAEFDGADMTAAELALGLLDGDDRAAAMRRVLAEPDFAREVQAWRERFAALFAAWPDTLPGADLEQRVMAATDGARTPAGSARRFWPVAAVSAIAAALVLTIAVVPQLYRPAPQVRPAPLPVPTPEPLLAAIASSKSGAPVVAFYDRAAGVVRLAGLVTVPAGRSAELWAIKGKDAPRSLGLIAGPSSRISITPALRGALADGVVLAISIEPSGGSPTGSPTGPVVATGTLTAA